jgi:hypothetical protein
LDWDLKVPLMARQSKASSHPAGPLTVSRPLMVLRLTVSRPTALHRTVSRRGQRQREPSILAPLSLPAPLSPAQFLCR